MCVRCLLLCDLFLAMASKLPAFLKYWQNLQQQVPSALFAVSSIRQSSSWEPRDVETHTGQIFEKDDYRLARFVDRRKEVNDNWAIKLIDETPPKSGKDRIVACDGGGGPLGHPKVYINLDKPGNHCCGYCGLRFYKDDHHH